MSVTDIFCEHLHTTTGLTKIPIRPINAAVSDKRPYVAIEEIKFRSLKLTNGTVYAYEGTHKVHCCADTHERCREIAQLVQDKLDGFSGSGLVYNVTGCTYDDSEDIAITEDEKGKPYYVASQTYQLTAEKAS